MDCADVPGLLPFLMENGLPEAEAAALRGHLASCPSCRQAETEARRLAETLHATPLPAVPALRRRAFPGLWPAAAAAALLAAFSIAWLGDGRPPEPPPAGPTARAQLRPTRALRAVAGSRFEDGPTPRLLAGRFWIRAERPVDLDLPGGRLRVGPGDACLLLPDPAATAFWLKDALAAGGGGTLLLLADTPAEAGGTRWTGPARVHLEDGTAVPLSDGDLGTMFDCRDETEGASPWQDLPPAAGLCPIPASEAGFVLEAEVKVPAGTQLGLAYPSPAGTSVLTLGSGALGAGARQVFRLRISEGRLELHGGARRLVSCDTRDGRPLAGHPGAGLLAWLGPVEVTRLRWRTLDVPR